MSTKTNFKRIALVAVSALGFGLMSVVPASAIATGINLTSNSITVVGSNGRALIGVTATNTAASTGLSANETVTVSVIGVPTNVTTTKTLAANGAITGQDLTLLETDDQANNSPIDWTQVANGDDDSGNGSESDTDGAIGANNTGYYGLNTATAAASTVTNRTYFVAVICSANCVDQGVYTLAFDLTNAQGAIVERELLKVDFVTAAANSGAVLTAASTGSWFIGDTPTIANQSSTRRISATLRNRDNGALRTASGGAPALSATVTDSASSPNIQVMSVEDDRTSEFGYSATQADNSAYADGNYSIFNSSAFTVATRPATLTVRYGLASATAAVSFNLAAVASTVATSSVTATGSVQGADANDKYLPLTTKSATVSNSVAVSGVAQTGYPVYYTISYSTSCVAGNMSPAATTTPVQVLTDSTGAASVTITNAFPLDTCAATVTWTGSATNPTSTNVITWQKPAATSVVTNPGGNYKAKTLSSNTVTWTILDQFSAPMASVPVQVTLAGANAPTAALATKTSDANGQVSHTWTDAKATTTSATDTINITSVNGVTVSLGSVQITYQATLDTVAKLEAKYQAPAALGGTPAAVTVDTLVPATAIGGTAGILNSAADQLDLTKALTAPTSGSVAAPWVRLVFTALDSSNVAVTGVPTTVKVTNGWIIAANGKAGTERIVYANDAISFLCAKTGTATVTATNGTLTSTATILCTDETILSGAYTTGTTSNARVLSATEANGVITAKVLDFHGNPVRFVSIQASATGEARFANGFNTISGDSLLTDANGEAKIEVMGAGTITVSLNTTINPKTRFAKDAGDVAGDVVTPGSPAGVSSVTVTTSGKANAAEAATDAALEAIDAANAAVDAANQATEAADAATVAAEEARDAADAATAAVEALAADVAKMINEIKAQLSAMAKTIATIAKRTKK